MHIEFMGYTADCLISGQLELTAPRLTDLLNDEPTLALPDVVLESLVDARLVQAATRALRDGKDEEYVVVALLHDIGESLGPFNHGEVIAAILRPFISRDNYFMLEHHSLFRTYFFASHMGLDPNARDRFKGDPAYDRTVEFCAKYDEISFDPNYANEPLSTFEPMVRRILAKGWTPPK